MFTRFINSIRETVSNNKHNNNATTKESTSSIESRRPSVTDELEKLRSNEPLNNLNRSNSVSQPIPIRPTMENNSNNKRRSSLFGISNVSYDDYVQKDLVSSSWS